ncbi:Type 1 glutamine amidotransferase-like domain-containing protein [Streptobacillus canis]|uniref:Type 1 glutamine amidotransferase-like domain-containing protein n=1 Tax=Streptobacillus canis TaxID=2678686 RepID=UPI0012E27FD0|nr:Type 1 glutamine amidotransferase-like domain-containing protein [Streptobacillus canis]
MRYYLTSAAINFEDRLLIKENGFIDDLKSNLKNPCSFLFVANNPENIEMTEKYAGELKNALEIEGIRVNVFNILDNRNKEKVEELVLGADLIFLAGGHVPTQNKFFHDISLKLYIDKYEGVLMSCSAGSMNSATKVYSIPEHDGEVIDKKYDRNLVGLGITDVQILPHFQFLKEEKVDGYKMIEDIAKSDSMGKIFYCLDDGSYVLGIRNKGEVIRGEAYILSDGNLKKICNLDEEYLVKGEL